MTYQHQAVRDLAWVISSPVLLQFQQADLPFSQELNDYTEWLAALDAQPEPLNHHIAAMTRHTLGHYFESLCLFWLQHVAGQDTMTHNIQLHDNGITLGEIDLLYRTNKQIYHIELSSKFYLYLPNSSDDLSCYIGPGVNDDLQKRVTKFERQCNILTTHPQFRQQLNIDDSTTIHTHKLLKGWLFYPYGTQYTAHIQTTDMHLRGDWLSLNQVPTYQPTTHYQILQKPHWLSPTQSDDATTLISHQQLHNKLTQHFSDSERPLLISALQQKGELFVEEKRAFIVPDHWPNISN